MNKNEDVIRRVALGPLVYDEFGTRCLFCPWHIDTDYDPMTMKEPHHHAACPIVLARKCMHEQGTPVMLFLVHYFIVNSKTKKGESLRETVYAFTELEAREGLEHWVRRTYPEGTTIEIRDVKVLRSI